MRHEGLVLRLDADLDLKVASDLLVSGTLIVLAFLVVGVAFVVAVGLLIGRLVLLILTERVGVEVVVRSDLDARVPGQGDVAVLETAGEDRLTLTLLQLLQVMMEQIEMRLDSVDWLICWIGLD